MAFSGYISNAEFSLVKNNVIAVGELIHVKFTIVNNGTVPFSIISYYYYKSGTLPEDNHDYLAWIFPSAVTVRPGNSVTLDNTASMHDTGIASGRTSDLWLIVNIFVGSGAPDEYIGNYYFNDHFYGVKVLDMRYKPTVTALTVTRTPSEDSTQLSATVKCSLAEGADSGDAGLALKLRWREAGDDVFADDNVTSVSVASALSSAGATVTLPGTFSAGTAYEIQAEFTDGYDTGVARTTVSKSHTNIHLSGSGYGFAVGQYSTGTQAAPLFESGYPARFYEGIEGVNVYTGEEVNTGGKWIDGKTIYAKTLQFSTPSTANAQTNHTYDFSDVDEAWVDASATFIVAGNAASHLGYVAGNGNRLFMVQLQKSSNNILLISNVEGTAYIRMMYTKA